MNSMKRLGMVGIISLLFLFFMAGPVMAKMVAVESGNVVLVSGLSENVTVQFRFNDGIPVFAKPNDAGEVRYKAISGGSINVTAIKDGKVINENEYNVEIEAVEEGSKSGGGSGGGGGSSGGGSGGGGVVTGEPFDNIVQYESHDNDLRVGQPVTYSFKTDNFSIYEVVITGNANEYDVTVRVELLKSPTLLADEPAPGAIYQNQNVWIGSYKIKEAVIKFRVKNSWINKNGVVKLYGYDENKKKWISLDIKEINKDGSYTYFEAKTDSFSEFAISSAEGETVPSVTPTVSVTEKTPTATSIATSTAEPVETTKSPGFEIVTVIVTVSAIYLYRRKGR